MAFGFQQVRKLAKERQLAALAAETPEQRQERLAKEAVEAQKEADRVQARALSLSAMQQANGSFLRFLDLLEESQVKLVPRWSLTNVVTKQKLVPIESFQLQPLWFGFGTAYAREFAELGWDTLAKHLDYPQEAKQRLLELALPEALKWCDEQHQKRANPLGSRGERLVREACEWMYTGHFFPNVRPHWFRPEGHLHTYELDGYCATLPMAFEYQGEHHTELLEGETLLERMKIDAWKRYVVMSRGIYFFDVYHYELPNPTRDEAARVVMKKLSLNRIGREFLAKMNNPQAIAFRDQSGFKV